MTINDERTNEGVEHLQTAALELIAAARVFLDAAEELVHDRDRIHDVVATVTSLATVPADLFGRRRAPRPRRPPGPILIDDDDDDLDVDDLDVDGVETDVVVADGHPTDGDESRRPPVRHIDVS